MYGTVAHARVKAGKEQEGEALMQAWARDRKPTLPGCVRGYTFQLDSDPNAIIIVAVFDSKESYVANANDPEQDVWYRQLRETLEDDPTWHDGEVISAI